MSDDYTRVLSISVPAMVNKSYGEDPEYIVVGMSIVHVLFMEIASKTLFCIEFNKV